MPTKYYLPDLQKYEFQKAVIDKDLLTPPGSPVAGDRYLINGVGAGAWSGQDDNIATWDGTAWIFATKREGMMTWVKDESKVYIYTGAVWDGDFIHEHANKALLDSYTQTEADLATAVTDMHVQGTDQGLDTGGANAVTAAQAKEAYTKRAVYDADLGCIVFDI